MIRKTILTVVLALLVVSTAAAAKPVRSQGTQQFTFAGANGGGQANPYIEKQSWWLTSSTLDPDHTVVNSTSCTWDINDHYDFWVSGSMAAGQSESISPCHISDFDPFYSCRVGLCTWWSARSNWFGVRVTSPSTALAVSLCYSPQQRCFVPNPVWDKDDHVYVYKVCAQAKYSYGDQAIIEIPGSNGGLGVPTTMTFTVGNPTGRTVKPVRADWGLSSDAYYPVGCDSIAPPTPAFSTEYPFRWLTS